MDITLSGETRRLIEERMRRSGYEDPDAVIRAGLATLDQQDALDDLAPGEMMRLLLAGERSGHEMDGEAVLAELAALRRRAAGSSVE